MQETSLFVSAFKSRLETGDRPYRVLANDGKHYLIKHYVEFPAHREKLAFEYFAARLAFELGVPVPPVKLLSFNAAAFADVIGGSGRFFPQKVLGYEWVPIKWDVTDIDSGVRELILKESSHPSDILEIGIFDTWLNNTDRIPTNLNLIFNGKRLLGIDFGAVFDQDYNQRLVKEENLSNFFQPHDKDAHIFGSQLFYALFKQHSTLFRSEARAIATRIESVREDLIDSIQSEIPAEWEQSEERKTLRKAYLLHRKDKLKSVVQDLLDLTRYEP
jgi:hypothetical protein